MIINTGQRTDIPAFYSKWLINRIKEGYVMVRNPYNPKLVTKFSLDPNVVDVLAFCSKNPHPILKYLDFLKPFGQLWYITITAYDNDLEPNVPPIDNVIEDFKYLATHVGKNAIVWRYTPIIINEKYSIQKHLETFEYIASKLEGYTSVAVFGFVDLYEKLKKNQPEIVDCSEHDKIIIAKEFLKIAKKHHMELRLCSKEKWLKDYDIDVNGCILLNDYEKAIGYKLDIINKSKARGSYCACYLANDIGAYNSCLHLCKYCYANNNKIQVMDNYQNHDDNSPLLIGQLKDDDQVIENKDTSNKVSFLLF